VTDLERIERDKATILAIIKYVLIIAIVAVIIYCGFWLFGVLLPFVFGFVMSQVANHAASGILGLTWRIRHRREARAKPAAAQPSGPKKRGTYPHGLVRSHKEKRLAITIYFLEVIAVIMLALVILQGGIVQLRNLARYLPDLLKNADLGKRIVDYLKELSVNLGGLFQADFLTQIENAVAQFQDQVVQSLPGVAARLLSFAASFVGSLPMIVFVIIVVIMSGYYFTADNRFLYAFLRRNITSRSFLERSVSIVSTLSKSLFRVIGSYLFLFLLTFLMALGGLMIIRMPYPVIFALVLAIVDLLPIFGIGATLIPISIYMFITGSVFGGVGALVLLVVMILIRRVIEPPIMGNAIKLHPMATLVSMIIGVGVYGLGGIIIGPIIFVVAREVMSCYGFDKKIREMIGSVLNKVSG
jgi:sporulation integral membrane protein YtvI